MSMKKQKVLLTYIESGMGHIMSMSAIADGLKEKYGDDLEILESYIMSDDKEAGKFEKFIMDCVKSTNKNKALGMGIFALLGILGGQHFMRLVHKTLFRRATDATVEAMRRYNPDIIVSTHYFITYAAIELKRKYMPDLTVITYNPDNNVHVWWDSRTDLFINNNAYATEEAVQKRGFDPKTTYTVFFSARKEVATANQSKEYYREKYNLPKDKFTIMIADGAYASAKSKKICDRLLSLDFPLTIIILAGKNQKVYRYFEEKSRSVSKNITLVPVNFTPLAYEYYGASDVFVSKAGPNATLDSLFMGTPVIFDFYAQPMEKATAKLFSEKLGCGISAFSTEKVVKTVKELYRHPERLEALKKNIAINVNREKNGIFQIADIIMHEARKKSEANAETETETETAIGSETATLTAHETEVRSKAEA